MHDVRKREMMADERHPDPPPLDDKPGTLLSWLRQVIGAGDHAPDERLRDVLSAYMSNSANGNVPNAVADHERDLMSNVLRLRHLTVVDVMIPRADIAAIEIGTTQRDLLSLLSERQFSRFPVYRETLDDVVGSIHIKDILAALAQGKTIVVESLVRDVPIVSPAMPVLDLLLMMKHKRKHMALVVDEHGGIDGLVTIGDVIEMIIGEVEDEHESSEEPKTHVNADGTIVADARFDVDVFEREYGRFLTHEEREDIDTLGGLIFAIAGHIPARGEIIAHSSGVVFEILDADPRRVSRVLVRNIPQKS